jgi:hypothetical protein
MSDKIKKVYIQQENGQFQDDWLYYAYLGFKDKKIKIEFFECGDDYTLPYGILPYKNFMIVGWIQYTMNYFNIIKNKNFFDIPKPLNVPDSIKKYAMRNFNVVTMGDFKKDTTLPIFVKPYDKLKMFSGGVIKKSDSRRFFYNDVPDDTLVMTSDVLDIVTEYRCFVNKNKLVGIKHYNGDFDKFIDVDVVRAAINDYVEQPIAYTIDFGLTSDNKTVLIECNDAWSICNYGLDPETYVNMLINRWIEIFNLY